MDIKDVCLNDISLLQIFSFISTKKLKEISTVNKKWNQLVKEELANRKKDFNIELYIGGNKWFKDSNDEQMIIKQNDFIIEYKSFLQKTSMIQPKLFLQFLTTDFSYGSKSILHDLEIIDPCKIMTQNVMPAIRRRKILALTSQLIIKLLPQNASSLFVIGDSILANDSKEYTGNTTQKNMARNFGKTFTPIKPAISSLMLSDGIGSYRFETKQLTNQAELLLNIINETELKRFFGADHNETVRLILIFYSDFYRDSSQVFKIFLKNLKKVKQSLNDKLVIAGYVINDVFSNQNQTDYTNIDSGITFVTLISKNDRLDDVKIAQMILPGPNDNEEPDYVHHPDHPDYPEDYHLKEKIKLLKSTGIYSQLDTNNIFALVSKSLRRENEMIDDSLVRLKKEFPNIPIFGFKSKSKIGHDHFPGLSRIAASRINQINYDVTFYGDYFMDSSIFTFVSVKNLN